MSLELPFMEKDYRGAGLRGHVQREMTADTPAEVAHSGQTGLGQRPECRSLAATGWTGLIRRGRGSKV